LVFKKMDAEDLKFPNEYFDLIFGNSVLHHLDNLERASKELKRVLKKGGKGVFLDPLAYNPVINIYRKMAMGVRTHHEHPLTYDDLETIKNHFKSLKHREMHLFTLLIFCSFFLIERVHPNQARYWKKIIQEGRKYKGAFNVLYAIDRVVLNIFPFLRKYCWVIIVEVNK
jgi:SAM-dependent methyltransferase